MSDILDARQCAVADRVLDEESLKRRHLVVSLSDRQVVGRDDEVGLDMPDKDELMCPIRDEVPKAGCSGGVRR